MFDDPLRAAKDRMLTPAASSMPWLHPTSVTLVAFLAGLVAGFCLTQQRYGLGLLFWLLNRFLDGFDGTLARTQNHQSDLGGYLDILLDFVIYALIPIALVVGHPSLAHYHALIFLLSSFYVNSASWMYLAAIIEKRAASPTRQTTIIMPVGLIGGTETFGFYCLFILLPQHLTPLYLTMGLLVCLTIGQRLKWAISHLDQNTPNR